MKNAMLVTCCAVAFVVSCAPRDKRIDGTSEDHFARSMHAIRMSLDTNTLAQFDKASAYLLHLAHCDAEDLGMNILDRQHYCQSEVMRHMNGKTSSELLAYVIVVESQRWEESLAKLPSK